MPVPVLRLAGRLTGREAAVARLCDSLLVGRAEITADLQWQPAVGLAAAMQITGDWFKAHA